MFVVILAAIVAVLLFYLYAIHKEQRDARSPKEEPGRRTKAKTRDTKTAASPTVSERVQSQIKPNESTTPAPIDGEQKPLKTPKSPAQTALSPTISERVQGHVKTGESTTPAPIDTDQKPPEPEQPSVEAQPPVEAPKAELQQEPASNLIKPVDEPFIVERPPTQIMEPSPPVPAESSQNPPQEPSTTTDDKRSAGEQEKDGEKKKKKKSKKKGSKEDKKPKKHKHKSKKRKAGKNESKSEQLTPTSAATWNPPE